MLVMTRVNSSKSNSNIIVIVIFKTELIVIVIIMRFQSYYVPLTTVGGLGLLLLGLVFVDEFGALLEGHDAPPEEGTRGHANQGEEAGRGHFENGVDVWWLLLLRQCGRLKELLGWRLVFEGGWYVD